MISQTLNKTHLSNTLGLIFRLCLILKNSNVCLLTFFQLYFLTGLPGYS